MRTKSLGHNVILRIFNFAFLIIMTSNFSTIPENRKELDDAIKKAKRFPVPSNNITFDTTATSENSDPLRPTANSKRSEKQSRKSTELASAVESGDEEVKEKKARKSAKNFKKTAAKERNENILDKYIQSQQHIEPQSGIVESYSDTSSFRINPASTSTPLRQHNLPNYGQNIETQSVISAYKQQLDFYKNRCTAAEKEVRQLREKCNKLEKQVTEKGAANSSTSQADDTLAEFDQIFLSNEETESPSLMKLQKGVICNSAAYKEAMKSDKISKFFSAMCVGIYGKEDFATRCVARRKDNMDQRQLSPTKTEAIDAEFYKWMKIHKFTSLQIRQNLAKCNTYYHNAITAIRRSKDPEDRSSKTTPSRKSSSKETEKNSIEFPSSQSEQASRSDLESDEPRVENNERDLLAQNTDRSKSSSPSEESD